MITMLLAGIDNIGMHIENPIIILPMSAYCSVIHDNLLVAAGDWSMATAQVRIVSSFCIHRIALLSLSLPVTGPWLPRRHAPLSVSASVSFRGLVFCSHCIPVFGVSVTTRGDM